MTQLLLPRSIKPVLGVWLRLGHLPKSVATVGMVSGRNVEKKKIKRDMSLPSSEFAGQYARKLLNKYKLLLVTIECMLLIRTS